MTVSTKTFTSRRNFFKIVGIGSAGTLVNLLYNQSLILESKELDFYVKFVSDRLKEDRSTKYYKWTPANKEHTIWMKVPKDNEIAKGETPMLVHLCNPKGYFQAAQQKDFSMTYNMSGYIINGKCRGCGYQIS